ncbi:MAG: SDR family oxidoreductase [Acidimicrobiales bacterium]|jgi:NAD(P)-dependent dehydrogenase (short-subunit alcohol dehydrogenase family)
MPLDDRDLHGQRVVVLGGTSGIGLATAAQAAVAGARVTVVSGRKASVERALAELPPGSAGHAIDLTDAASVQTFFDDLGDFDHLVYTAGESLVIGTLDALDLDAARRFFDVRYFGALAAARASAPHLRPGGSITLTTGGALARPRPGWSVAVSVLGAVDALTRALAVELAPVRVNAVCPGVVRSPLWAGMSDSERDEFYRTVGSGLLTGRVGEVSDIAHGYLSLMTQPYATGSVLTLDGGGALT